jgi:hypothetical protein
MTISENAQLVFSSSGKYIRFGGRGIIDGLKQVKCKRDFYKIIGECAGSQTQVNGLEIKGYRAKRHSILPFYCFNQECEIIDSKEFKQLPEYQS